jgi:hypothetical protein
VPVLLLGFLDAVDEVGLLVEIRAMGHHGNHNLLVRYLNQGRHLDDHPHLSPRRAARLLLTPPEIALNGNANDSEA